MTFYLLFPKILCAVGIAEAIINHPTQQFWDLSGLFKFYGELQGYLAIKVLNPKEGKQLLSVPTKTSKH